LQRNMIVVDCFILRVFGRMTLYIYFLVYLLVCLYLINDKTIGPKFCVGPHMNPGKVKMVIMKNVSRKHFDFRKVLKIHEKIRRIFCYCFKMYEQKILTNRATIRSWNGRWVLVNDKPVPDLRYIDSHRTRDH